MLYRRDHIRHYVEQGIEWSSVLFFLFLFALAGVVKYSGIGDVVAQKLISSFGERPDMLSGIILYSGGILSSVLDNTVVVASYVPVISGLGSLQMDSRPLWWAILFGACYGGNITIIGSTANIVAMDILERERQAKIAFLQWLKIGLLVGLVSMTIAYLFIVLAH